MIHIAICVIAVYCLITLLPLIGAVGMGAMILFGLIWVVTNINNPALWAVAFVIIGFVAITCLFWGIAALVQKLQGK